MKTDKWLNDDGETWLVDPDDIMTDTGLARIAGCAPELLEALENIENDDGRIPAKIWEMRNRAIAKARGK